MEIIPVWDTLIVDRKKFRESTLKLLLSRASFKLGISGNELEQYDLMPWDIGLKSWRIPDIAAQASQDAWTMAPWVKTTVPHNHVLIICGLAWMGLQSGPDELVIECGITRRAWFHLAKLYLMEPVIKRIAKDFKKNPSIISSLAPGLRAEAYFSNPVMVDPTETLEVKLKSYKGLAGGGGLILLGYAAKPIGEVTA